MPLPKIGCIAPTFTLLDQNGDSVALKDFRGEKNVVLYFYPKALTPGLQKRYWKRAMPYQQNWTIFIIKKVISGSLILKGINTK